MLLCRETRLETKANNDTFWNINYETSTMSQTKANIDTFWNINYQTSTMSQTKANTDTLWNINYETSTMSHLSELGNKLRQKQFRLWSLLISFCTKNIFHSRSHQWLRVTGRVLSRTAGSQIVCSNPSLDMKILTTKRNSCKGSRPRKVLVTCM
jgi:hypothetical protein